MGKNKGNEQDIKEDKFIPRISSASRKLAARRFEQASFVGIPHFMREIKCKANVPLAPITPKQSFESDNIDSSNQPSEKEIKLKTERQVLQPITMNGKPSLLDDNVFTFKPKLSSASAKIVENMGTDFMARQQQHLEKQKKIVSFFLYKGFITLIYNDGDNLMTTLLHSHMLFVF